MLRTSKREIIHLFLERTEVNASKTCINLPNAINHFLNGKLINIWSTWINNNNNKLSFIECLLCFGIVLKSSFILISSNPPNLTRQMWLLFLAYRGGSQHREVKWLAQGPTDYHIKWSKSDKDKYNMTLLICRILSGVGNGNLLQYSCLENPMDRGDLQTIVLGVAKSQTGLVTNAHMNTYIEKIQMTIYKTEIDIQTQKTTYSYQRGKKGKG